MILSLEWVIQIFQHIMHFELDGGIWNSFQYSFGAKNSTTSSWVQNWSELEINFKLINAKVKWVWNHKGDIEISSQFKIHPVAMSFH